MKHTGSNECITCNIDNTSFLKSFADSIKIIGLKNLDNRNQQAIGNNTSDGNRTKFGFTS